VLDNNRPAVVVVMVMMMINDDNVRCLRRHGECERGKGGKRKNQFSHHELLAGVVVLTIR
jgi:hypothetical protein